LLQQLRLRLWVWKEQTKANGESRSRWEEVGANVGSRRKWGRGKDT
jgi:hypothetical protein